MRTHSIAIHSDLRASGEPKKRAGFSKPLSCLGNINGSQAADCSSVVHARRTRFTAESLEALHAGLNSTAQRIRSADRNTETIETFIDKMKTRLKTILKQYPPFPPGSEERVRLLRSFNAFRKQIDQLTIPPREEFAEIVPAEPNAFGESEDYGEPKGVRSQRVNRASPHLNIPEIGEKASDDEVAAVLEGLDALSEMVGQRRAELAADAVTIGRFLGHGGFGETMENDIEAKSLELRDTVRSESINSLTNAQDQLMELL
jgi:hypothetical protein